MAAGWTGISERSPQSSMAKEYPYAFQCPEPNCYMSVAMKSLEEAQKTQDTHRCPTIGDTTVGWGVTKTLVQQVWDMLDAAMDQIMADPSVAKMPKTEATARARALADVLAIFMVPHFRTPKEIAAEAKRRYEAKRDGVEYETPGLGNLKYMTPPGTPVRSMPGVKKATAPMKAVPDMSHKLTEQEITAIKAAHESGLFKAEDLAKIYKVSVAAVNSVLS